MSNRETLLVVDDDRTLREAVEVYLGSADYEVITASDGLEGLQKMYAHHPALILLDVMMPKLDGLQTCRRIREVSKVPIIMLTAKGQESDKVKGLELGADDYVTKPFSLKELGARVQAVLRRSEDSCSNGGGVLFADDELVIDSESGQVLRSGEKVGLTATERRLLFFLAENSGQILHTSRILESVWGHEYVDEVGYVKIYVWRLRQKIEPHPEEPMYILTERGIGYRFAD